jgi:hypothetical protein
MKKYFIFLSLYLFFFSFTKKIYSQDLTIAEKDYLFSFEIKDALENKKMGTYRAAEFYSFIGDYQMSVETFGNGSNSWGFDSVTCKKMEYLKKFAPKNAEDYILAKAKDYRIVIFNEAHHIPLHRVFLKNMLGKLKLQGFNALGLEALTNCKNVPEGFQHLCDNDSLLNQRGYPINLQSAGPYTQEPQMANLIRIAHQEKYKIFSYEKFGPTRELDQAKYITEYLEENPNDKLIILCGYAHLFESFLPDYDKRMAVFLKELTGIDPLTIDQCILTEGNPERNVEFYKWMNFDEATVFVNENNEPFNGWHEIAPFDMVVYHPRTQYVHGRPHWLINQDGYTLYYLDKDKITLDFPVLVKVWNKKEPEIATPIEVIEVKSRSDNSVLVLPKGEYLVKVEDVNKNEQYLEFEIK